MADLTSKFKRQITGQFEQVLRVLLSVTVVVTMCRGKVPTINTTTSSTTTTTTEPPELGTNRTRRSDVLGLFNSKLHKKFALLGSLSSSNHQEPEPEVVYGPPLTVSS